MKKSLALFEYTMVGRPETGVKGAGVWAYDGVTNLTGVFEKCPEN
jgi:hypothetical protein